MGLSYMIDIIYLMYKKKASILLLVMEYGNLAIIIVFMWLFSSRLYALRQHSLTDKFKHYFPKLRIFFCLAYVALSISLLGYNLATQSYEQSSWYEYVLQGGGGECMNSCILGVQLGVLRLQLKKEQPYTRYHLWYCVYLMIISLARLVLTAIDTGKGENDLANLIIAALLLTDTLAALVYWAKNRQSLPEFIHHTSQQIDQSRYQTVSLQRRVQKTKRSFQSRPQDSFPYIRPFLSIFKGRFKIDLERIVPQNYSSISDEGILNDSFLEKESNSDQQLSSQLFSLDEIKKFYTICGRLSLKCELIFGQDQRSFIRQLQVFLEELFSDRQNYTSSVLGFLKIRQQVIENYQILREKIGFEYKNQINPNSSYFKKTDKKAPYISLNLYRYLWVHDHYQYYMRVSLPNGGQISYPIKNRQQIEQNHHLLKKIIKTKGKSVQLPGLPKMHIFAVREDEILQQHIEDLEIYLRKLVNQQGLMDCNEAKEKLMQFLGFDREMAIMSVFNPNSFNALRIQKGRINKALKKGQYITIYEFKLKKADQLVNSISKRFSEIQQLHHDIQRWSRNRRNYFDLSLPQKIIYKPQIRHEKMRAYLQSVIELPQAYKCYSILNFFEESEDSVMSILSSARNSPPQAEQKAIAFNDFSPNENESLQVDDSARSSNMFSKIIDDLGNQEYD